MPAPPNDDIANATAITSATITQATLGATTSLGEDLQIAGAANPVGATVWFTYTPDFTGPATFDTNSSDFDTTLQVFTLTDAGAPVSYGNLTEIGGNDDNGTGGNKFDPAFYASTVTVNVTAGQTYYVQAGGSNNDAGDLVLNAVPAPCYASGTLIRTVSGEVAVEHLAVGDIVVTASGGHRPIRWIGHRTLDCTRHPRPEAVRPVRVLADAFGEGLPRRDLFLSPDHAVRVTVLDDVLIPIKHLLNDATIAQVEHESVTYWHVELDSHDILVAEGLPAESFLDTGVRAGFANAGAFMTLHPDFAPLTLGDFCLPLVQEGVIVDAVRARLLARAAAMGWRFTAEDDLYLLVDGVAVRPDREGASARFAIPASAAEVRLVSRSFVPERIDVSTRDGRRLGVPLRGLSVLDADELVRSLPIEHALLAEGYSFVQEQDGEIWRWTDGDALVPAALWAGLTGDIVLTVETAPERGTMRAWQAPEAQTIPSAAAGRLSQAV